ncbi:phage tail tape measure protein [Neobacillus mesonae]|uniref:phage tail tape measure protein n=1 Tax=Neobacillus mesonae TaxID=1193713 RepID=UPI0025730421|nr:phage tail tape measure protein [Neobacillus mesonae]
MSKQYSIVTSIVARTDQFTSGINDATNKMNSLSKSFADKTKAIGDGLNNVGKKLTTFVTLPIAGLGTAVVATGINFDKQMSKVQAISGATGEEFKQLRDLAKELGRTTQFSATQAGEGMEYLALAGWKTKDIMAAMPGMLDLAAAGALDLGRAADITSDTMQAFKISASDATHTADVFAYAQANANTNVEQLGEAMKYLAPVAHALGWNLEESTAAIMAVSDAGIKGSMAGQAFATSLARLAKPTKYMAGTIDELGLEFFDAEGKMKSMPEVLAEIERGTAGMTQEQKSAVLSILFGAQAYKHWAVLLEKGSDALQDNTDKLKNADGTAKKMAETMMDNLGGSITALKSALEGLAISFYDIVKGDIRRFTDYLTELTRKFTELDEGSKKVIIVIAGIAAAIGPLLMTLGLLIKSVGMVVSVLGAVSLPVVAVVAAIGLLVGAFVYAYNESETFRNGVATVFQKIKDVALLVFGIVRDFIMEKVSEIRQFWDENGAQISKAVENCFYFIKSVIDFVMPAVLLVISTIWGNIKGVINGALNIIMGLIKVFAGLFTGDFSKMWEGVKQLFKGALEFVWNLVNLMLVGKLIGGIKSFVTKGIESFTSFWTKSVDIFKNLDTHVWNIISKFVSNIVGKLKSFYNEGAQIFGTLKTFGANTFQALWTAIKIVVGNIYSGVVNKLTSMVTGVKFQFSGLLSTAKSIFNSIKSAITNPIETAKNVVKSAIDKIKGFFSNMKVKIPMPHFNFTVSSKEVAGIKVPFPKVSVDWYKRGGFFDSPQLIGIGEAGKEAVLPLVGRQMDPFADAVYNRLAEKFNLGNRQPESMVLHNTFNFTVNGAFSEKDAKKATDLMFKKLDKGFKERGLK